MMCNVWGPYDPAIARSVPTFSRVRDDLLFESGDMIEVFALPSRRPIAATWTLSRNTVRQPFREGRGGVG